MTRSLSLLALIAANSVPLLGVLFYGWDASLVLALFWIENLIIGAFNLVKMLILAARAMQLNELFLCFFFVLHFGLFCSAHGLLLWDLLDLGKIDASLYFGDVGFGPLGMFAEGASVFIGFIDLHGSVIMLGMAALALSHTVSFIEHFILRGEIFTLTNRDMMARPYGQILAMHAGLILGAIAIDKFGSTVALLAVIVAIKLLVDLKLHTRRHKLSSDQVADQTPPIN